MKVINFVRPKFSVFPVWFTEGGDLSATFRYEIETLFQHYRQGLSHSFISIKHFRLKYGTGSASF